MGQGADETGGAARTDEGDREAPRWTRRTLLISALLASLLVGLVGSAGYLFVRLTDLPPPAARFAPPPPPPGPAASGPRAGAHPVIRPDDLDRVCDGWYYPGAPKYRGEAPHPVLISVRDRPDLEYRTARTLNAAAYAGPAAKRTAWASEPSRAQLVACLDLIDGGRKLRSCPADGAELPLKQGRYRLRVYEVATGRKVAETRLTGKDDACPWVAMTGADRSLYTAVDDDQLYTALRKRVES